MKTTFDAWLAQLTTSGRRIPDGRITIDEGLPFGWGFLLGGDWTGAALACSLRLTPDTPDPTLLDLTTTVETYDPTYVVDDGTVGATPFTITATDVQTAALATALSLGTADTLGVATVAIDFIITPSGGDPWRIMGGTAVVQGKVTNA